MNDSSTGRRWFELVAQAFIFYGIVSYFADSEMSAAGYTAESREFFHWSERIVGAFFVFEYLFRWSRAQNKLRYPVTALALIDLLAVLPFFLALAVDMRSLKLIRTLRVLRLLKLYRYNSALYKVLYGFRKVKDELVVLGFTIVIVVMVSSVAMHEFEHEVQPDKFHRLSDAVWWSFVTLTTVGYGDVSPMTIGGRAVAVITMIVGIGIFGTFVSLIGSSFLATFHEIAHQQQTSPPDVAESDAQPTEPRVKPWLSETAEAEMDRAA